ncbi:Uncharacterised protein [uncultured archaeon]|nr:Uncharacterised protein [uncultured archaeon]
MMIPVTGRTRDKTYFEVTAGGTPVSPSNAVEVKLKVPDGLESVEASRGLLSGENAADVFKEFLHQEARRRVHEVNVFVGWQANHRKVPEEEVRREVTDGSVEVRYSGDYQRLIGTMAVFYDRYIDEARPFLGDRALDSLGELRRRAGDVSDMDLVVRPFGELEPSNEFLLHAGDYIQQSRTVHMLMNMALRAASMRYVSRVPQNVDVVFDEGIWGEDRDFLARALSGTDVVPKTVKFIHGVDASVGSVRVDAVPSGSEEASKAVQIMPLSMSDKMVLSLPGRDSRKPDAGVYRLSFPSSDVPDVFVGVDNADVNIYYEYGSVAEDSGLRRHDLGVRRVFETTSCLKQTFDSVFGADVNPSDVLTIRFKSLPVRGGYREAFDAIVTFREGRRPEGVEEPAVFTVKLSSPQQHRSVWARNPTLLDSNIHQTTGHSLNPTSTLVGKIGGIWVLDDGSFLRTQEKIFGPHFDEVEDDLFRRKHDPAAWERVQEVVMEGLVRFWRRNNGVLIDDPHPRNLRISQLVESDDPQYESYDFGTFEARIVDSGSVSPKTPRGVFAAVFAYLETSTNIDVGDGDPFGSSAESEVSLESLSRPAMVRGVMRGLGERLGRMFMEETLRDAGDSIYFRSLALAYEEWKREHPPAQ